MFNQEEIEVLLRSKNVAQKNKGFAKRYRFNQKKFNVFSSNRYLGKKT
jgi:hypothetical protein